MENKSFSDNFVRASRSSGKRPRWTGRLRFEKIRIVGVARLDGGFAQVFPEELVRGVPRQRRHAEISARALEARDAAGPEMLVQRGVVLAGLRKNHAGDDHLAPLRIRNAD